MYLSRTNSLLYMFLYVVLTSGWVIGAWLLVRRAFRLHHAERMVVALVTGFLLFIEVSNLYAHLLPIPACFWAASVTIFIAGIAFTWRLPRQSWFERGDWEGLVAVFGVAGVTVLYTLILRGQSIFDEYLHLPLISTMAAGNIPPNFYLNPNFYFAYHYGLQVYAASLVRQADFFPWSAWDLSRAVAIAFTLVLGWAWVKRITRSRLAAWTGTILFTFAGGVRWLLLLFPSPWLAWISKSVNLADTGLDTAPTLALALHRAWNIEGGGPMALPFAFHSGIFVPGLFTLGSTGSMPFMTLLLLLILLPRDRFTAAGLIIWGLLFASMALSAEHLFAFTWAGVALAASLAFLFRKHLKRPFPILTLYQWGIILFASALLALLQGGFITEIARNLLDSISGSAAQSMNAYRFNLRWPPGLQSADLGDLTISNPGQLITLLLELGPALLLVPVVFIRFKKQLLHRDWLTAGLAISILLSLTFPLFLQYGVDRSTTRMPSTALWTSLVLGFPILWTQFTHAKPLGMAFLSLGYVAIILSGVVIFRTQLASMHDTQYSYYIDRLDASFAADYWNKLPQGAQILDPTPERSVTIFGRITRAYTEVYEPLPDWEALIKNPNPSQITKAGYDYVYMDRAWWDRLTRAQQSSFLQACLDVLDERKQDEGENYRLLFDVGSCK